MGHFNHPYNGDLSIEWQYNVGLAEQFFKNLFTKNLDGLESFDVENIRYQAAPDRGFLSSITFANNRHIFKLTYSHPNGIRFYIDGKNAGFDQFDEETMLKLTAVLQPLLKEARSRKESKKIQSGDNKVGSDTRIKISEALQVPIAP